MTDKVTINHGYIDPACQRLTKPGPDGRPVLHTFLAMVELRLAGYDAIEIDADVPTGAGLYYYTTQPYRAGDGTVLAIGNRVARRVYGPNMVLGLLTQAAHNPDAKLAPTVTTTRATKTHQPCHVCGRHSLTVDGEWSLGLKLATGYTPQPGELVKNHYMACASCGFEQAS